MTNDIEYFYKMGIIFAQTPEQMIFDKVNECRAVLGYAVYVDKEEFIRDLKKLDEYEKLKQENKKQKEIIKILKLININIGIDIVNNYSVHYFEPNADYNNNHIVISKEQYEILKEWIDNERR